MLTNRGCDGIALELVNSDIMVEGWSQHHGWLLIRPWMQATVLKLAGRQFVHSHSA